MYDIIKSLYDEIQLVLFLGDCVEDFEDLGYIYPEKNFLHVSGNCDFNRDAPNERILDVGNKKILMSHGHRYRVKSGYGKIMDAAQELGADICLYGHSHTPHIVFERGIHLMNPGSISQPRGVEYPSYGVINIEGEKVEMTIVEVGIDGI